MFLPYSDHCDQGRGIALSDNTSTVGSARACFCAFYVAGELRLQLRGLAWE